MISCSILGVLRVCRSYLSWYTWAKEKLMYPSKIHENTISKPQGVFIQGVRASIQVSANHGPQSCMRYMIIVMIVVMIVIIIILIIIIIIVVVIILLMIIIEKKNNHHHHHHHHPNVVFFCQTPAGLSNSCSERNSFCAWSLSRCSSLRALACPQVLSVLSNKLCLHVYLPCCLSIWLTINMSMHTVWHTMCMQQRW